MYIYICVLTVKSANCRQLNRQLVHLNLLKREKKRENNFWFCSYSIPKNRGTKLIISFHFITTLFLGLPWLYQVFIPGFLKVENIWASVCCESTLGVCVVVLLRSWHLRERGSVGRWGGSCRGRTNWQITNRHVFMMILTWQKSIQLYFMIISWKIYWLIVILLVPWLGESKFVTNRPVKKTGF